MVSNALCSSEVISRAASFDGIRAGIVRLEDILQGPSYRATPQDQETTTPLVDADGVEWSPQARSVLVLGLYHPVTDPRLDWWERGDSWGNRRLRKVSDMLTQWLREEYAVEAQPLSYHVEKGGLFLKDAAVLSGIGIIGRSNLLLHPDWGPRIRLRSILLDEDLQPTQAIEGFSPCETCEGFCHKACPTEAFPQGKYSRSLCSRQMNIDVANTAPDGEIAENGKRHLVIKYCRACELSCPVGA